MQTVNKSKTMKASLVGLAALATLGATTIANADSYTVQQGDTLSAIAKKNNTTVATIVSENGIQDANRISIGQVLSINGQGTTTVSSDTSTATVAEPQTTTSTLSSSEAAAKEEIAQRESSGSYTAQNGQYYGRYQLTLSYLNGDLSPENQERVADNYVASRYGSWTAALAFWNANGWY